jgi:uncharacterized LabA/DUF88 family protein
LNIDVANLPREAIEKLVELAPQQGRVVISHAFGDFRREDMDELSVELYQFGFRLIHCPAWPTQRGRLKSVVDDVMAQDMRDQLEYAPEISTFIVASGDRNFIAVVNALKRHGKRVVVAADQESINRELRLCADEYIALPRLRGRYRSFVPAEPEPEIEFPAREELLEQIARLEASSDYLTLRKLLRGLVPDERAHDEKLRGELTNRINALVEGGDLKVVQRSIKGRVVNTLVLQRDVSPGRALGTPEEEGAGASRPLPRRRVRHKVSAQSAY